MVLYFDNLITDIPLPGRGRHLLKEDVRKFCEAYSMPKKLDIAKYTLASYALYPWSYVLIKYSLDDKNGYRKFDTYIKSLFPNAHIIHGRSDTQNEYKKAIRLLEKQPDKWIFYAPNSDHPLISSDIHYKEYIDTLLKKAVFLKKKYTHVSIIYSHFSEFLNVAIPGTPQHFLHGQRTKILEDDDISRIYLMPHGDFSSVQIVHIDQLKAWFDSVDVGDKRVIRAEDMIHDVIIKDQIIIAPKKELCAHFDRYEHMLGMPNQIQNDQIPPLLIPQGFFSNKVKIAYGYSKYRKGWLNINPCARKYSFRDEIYGTDLKITLEDMPIFWKSHIAVIDKNPQADTFLLHECAVKNKQVELNPWSLQNQPLTKETLMYWINYSSFRIKISLRKLATTIGIKYLLQFLHTKI